MGIKSFMVSASYMGRKNGTEVFCKSCKDYTEAIVQAKKLGVTRIATDICSDCNKNIKKVLNINDKIHGVDNKHK